MTPPADKLIFETINKALHAALSVDPDTTRALGTLQGKVFCIRLTTPAFDLFLTPDPDGIVVSPESDHSPDVTLTGDLFAFGKLLGLGKPMASADSKISIEGDVAAGQDLQKIMSGFDFDWEELLARVMGDTPARKAGNVIRGFGSWAKSGATLSRENLRDYFTEEADILPSAAAARRFESGVSNLRADVDRLHDRIQRLRQSASKS